MSQEFHPSILAADVTDQESGTLQSMGDAIRYGVPSVLTSGALGIYNTILDYGGKEQLDTQETISKYSEQAGDWYADRKQAVDLIGGIGASLLPGSYAMKGLQLARAGNTVGMFGKAMNLTLSKKEQYLKAALQEVATTGGIVPKLASANRLKYAAWEGADQAFMAAAFEAGTLATMHDAAMFDEYTLKDYAWNSTIGVAFGGVLGAGISSLTSKGILRAAAETVQAEARQFDVVFQGDKLGLNKGTQTLQLASDIADLHKATPTDLPFKFKLDGKEQTTTLNSAAALEKVRQRAVQTAEDKLAIQFTELAEGDAAFGQALYGTIKEALAAAKLAGKTPDEAIEIAHGYLANVQKVSSINLDRYALDQKKFYIDSAPKGDTSIERFMNIFTPERSRTTSRQAYVLGDDLVASDLKVVTFDSLGAKNLKEAFRANRNVDAILTLEGRYAVNPYSSNIKRVNEKPFVVRKYMHTETGTVTSQTIPTVGDIIHKGDVRFNSQGISVGFGRTFKQAGTVATHELASPLEASARWAWASKLSATQLLKVTGGTIDEMDLPMLTRLRELGSSETQLAEFTIREEFGNVNAVDILNWGQYLDNSRLAVAKKLAEMPDGKAFSTQHHAAFLNTTLDYTDQLAISGFQLKNLSPELAAKGVLPTEAALLPKNVAIEWNFGILKGKDILPEEAYNMNMGPSHLATKELTKEYQMLIRRDIGEKMAVAALGEHAALFYQAPDVAASGVTAEGAGASLFGASNAGYVEKAKLWVQTTGKSVALASQRLRDAAIETLSPSINGIRTDLKASAELGSITTALRKSQLRFTIVSDPSVESGKRLVSREAKRIMEAGLDEVNSWDDAIELAGSNNGLVNDLPINNKAVIDFLETIVKQNDGRTGKFTGLYNAAGLGARFGKPGEIYVPPVNTQKYPFYALVKTKSKLGVASDTTMITAKSEEQLRAYAAELSQDYDIFYKADTDAFHKAMGDYQYSMSINENTINSDLVRRGKLADAIPETRPENVLTDWLEWTAKQEEKLVRTAVQVGNRQFFSEMQFLSENYRTVAESQVRGLGSKLKSKISDPFGDYTKTALNISKQNEFPLLDSLNEFIDKVGFAAGNAIAAARSQSEKGILPWTEAQKVMQEYGMGGNLTPELYKIANEIYPDNVIKTALAKGNMWLATTTLRLDFINPLINMISTPIMIGTEVSALKRIIGGDSQLAADFAAVMKVAGPDGRAMPSTTSLISKAIGNYFGADKQALIKRYTDIGAIKEITQLYHETLDSLSFKSVVNPGKYAAKIDAAIEMGSKITGNQFAEDFTRFISADVMRQISEPLVAAGKLTAKEQDAFMSTFVNRVQGNYVTSQRPIVFQGTTGAAISLFQTFAFNVLQQLTRHIENGDKRTLMIFAGLQGSIFGMNGLPFFDAVNTHLVGSWLNANPQHNDAYNILPKFNKELGDWALYGSASAFPLLGDKWPALYTRGDINPRHITIVPTSFVDIPVVQAANKLYDTVSGLGKNLSGGADISEAMLRALEHQGWNRPLAGMAQVMNGAATTSKGSLISAASEFDTTAKLASMQDRFIEFGGVGRMLGARPMNESIALNNIYRNKAYDALDKERIDRLGQIVKTKLAGGNLPEQEEVDEFVLRYTRSGGRIENFSGAMQRWSKDANVSIVNQLMQRVGTPMNMKLQAVMGGEGLDDRLNAAPLLGEGE